MEDDPYAIELKLQPCSFNLCPADFCDPAQGVADPSALVERVVPPSELVEEAARIISAAGADLGGVEYLINDHDGGAYFYDIHHDRESKWAISPQRAEPSF